jgi:hypothetical protein
LVFGLKLVTSSPTEMEDEIQIPDGREFGPQFSKNTIIFPGHMTRDGDVVGLGMLFEKAESGKAESEKSNLDMARLKAAIGDENPPARRFGAASENKVALGSEITERDTKGQHFFFFPGVSSRTSVPV